MTNCGNSAVMKMIAQIVRRYGSECKATSSNFTFVIFMVIKRLAPNGGVKKPVSQQTTNKIPNWMGWIPRALVIGKNTGARTTTIANVSATNPQRKMNKAMSKSVTEGFVEIEDMNAPTVCGIWYRVSKRENAMETPTKIVAEPANAEVRINAEEIFFHVSLR